jgi:drug/metabolite transporter (DMT)-like permease
VTSVGFRLAFEELLLMSGFTYAFGSAFFAAATDALSKQALGRHSPFVIAWVTLAYSAPFLLPFLCFIPIPHLDWTFWATMALLLPLEACALILYMKALQISPLSLTIPFLSFTPAFTVLTSFVLLGEKPEASGIAGICLLVLGAYLLNVQTSGKGILQPLRAILLERGSLLMMLVAFIYSITSALGKVAIHHSSPLFMGVFYLPLISLALLPFAVRRGMRFSTLRSGGPLFLLIGVSQALMALCHFKAMSVILVSYMISVKRSSVLLSVIYGGVLFREAHLKERLAASLLMVLGVALIVL